GGRRRGRRVGRVARRAGGRAAPSRPRLRPRAAGCCIRISTRWGGAPAPATTATRSSASSPVARRARRCGPVATACSGRARAGALLHYHPVQVGGAASPAMPPAQLDLDPGGRRQPAALLPPRNPGGSGHTAPVLSVPAGAGSAAGAGRCLYHGAELRQRRRRRGGLLAPFLQVDAGLA